MSINKLGKKGKKHPVGTKKRFSRDGVKRGESREEVVHIKNTLKKGGERSHNG